MTDIFLVANRVWVLPTFRAKRRFVQLWFHAIRQVKENAEIVESTSRIVLHVPQFPGSQNLR